MPGSTVTTWPGRRGRSMRSFGNSSSGVDQDQLPAGERPVTRREVQDGRIRAAADDGVEGEEVGAAAEELRLELDLNLALRRARHKQALSGGEAGAGRPLGDAHPV